MPDGADSRVLSVISSISDMAPEKWDACAGSDNPFVSHAFLSALEDSGSANEEMGWIPRHIIVESPDGRVEACAPIYLKTHSYGEYVFDWGWADAYERAGGRYYPKLQCASPFSPVPGPRLLIDSNIDMTSQDELRRILLSGITRVADQLKVSSAHITFCNEPEWKLGGDLGYLQRIGQQYHWHNHEYKTFDDFLGTLMSRKRKAIKKERRQVAELGLDIRTITGHEMSEAYWDAFYQFYLATTDKKWGQNYLQREFFSLLGERIPDAIVMIMAFDGDKPVGGALNLRGSDCLYGRNWGSLETHKFLHFECCYYQAIDYAIEHGLARVEAGAQGPHKIQRGYLPVPTYSLHYIRDPGFENAVEDFVTQERAQVEKDIIDIELAYSPYRKS